MQASMLIRCRQGDVCGWNGLAHKHFPQRLTHSFKRVDEPDAGDEIELESDKTVLILFMKVA